ncbi:DUF2484 family protein [Falsirhodobacter xinxiangensis]|uniref:DUF2484 family protein n=1 Tax=Falsirhodobacter xinxiangensis TaxID=2530049 RepID=UPI0010AABB50|nr:DUF2484 family protein [Rhodobacter xinxiangensis]
MSVGLILGLGWLAAALLVLRRRGHAVAGWALAGAGIPILGLITLHHGPYWGLLALAVGVLPLRTVLRRGRGVMP